MHEVVAEVKSYRWHLQKHSKHFGSTLTWELVFSSPPPICYRSGEKNIKAMAVEHTARSATDYGYHVVFASDATSAFNKEEGIS
jgi:hypothetical protein